MKTISTTGRRADRTAGGFTLIELILVMMLICTVLGMAAPSLRGFFQSHQATDAAGQIVALAQYARTQAASEGRTYRLNFDTQGGQYWLTAQDGASFAVLGREFGRTFALPEGVTFESVTTVVTTDAGAQTVAATATAETSTATARTAASAPPGAGTATDCVDFKPDGSATTAKVRIIGRRGDRWEVGCPSPGESFRVTPVTEEAGS